MRNLGFAAGCALAIGLLSPAVSVAATIYVLAPPFFLVRFESATPLDQVLVVSGLGPGVRR